MMYYDCRICRSSLKAVFAQVLSVYDTDVIRDF